MHLPRNSRLLLLHGTEEKQSRGSTRDGFESSVLVCDAALETRLGFPHFPPPPFLCRFFDSVSVSRTPRLTDPSSLRPHQVASGNLHVLDFRRIKDTERSTATSLFLTAPPASQPTALALSILESSPVVAAPAASSAGEVTKKAGRLMGEDEKQKIREAIARAGSVEEVRALERMLAEGFVPEKESTGKGKAAAKTVE